LPHAGQAIRQVEGARRQDFVNAPIPQPLLFHPHGAIKQRILGVEMEVDELVRRHAVSL